jgi:hypothetical protein
MSNPPDYFQEDYEDNLEERCPYCKEQFGIHTAKNIILCALNEIHLVKGVENK